MSYGKLGERTDIDSHRCLILGGSHARSRATRPQRRRHRPGRRVLHQAVRNPAAKLRPGYANFAIADPPLKLVLLENPGQGGSLNHLGIEVPDTGTVDAEQARLTAVGLASVDKRDTTCCYARQDKFWVPGAPDGEGWEIYTVLDSETIYDTWRGAARRCAAVASARSPRRCSSPPRRAPTAGPGLPAQGISPGSCPGDRVRRRPSGVVPSARRDRLAGPAPRRSCPGRRRAPDPGWTSAPPWPR